jgi:hypothetical protein
MVKESLSQLPEHFITQKYKQVLRTIWFLVEGRNLLLGSLVCNCGVRGSVVVKALCYKPEGRGFDSRLGEFLNLHNPSGRTRSWGLLSL